LVCGQLFSSLFFFDFHRTNDIATSVGVGSSTVYRTKRRFVEGNLERALSEEQRPGAERKLTGKEEALPSQALPAAPEF
jgi:transposase